MTAAEVTTQASAVHSLEALLESPARYVGTAIWWSRLASTLEFLREEISRSDVRGLVQQVIQDAPELAARALRLPSLEEAADAEAYELRLAVAAKSGSRREALAIRESVSALVTRVRNLDQQSQRLLRETYMRDFGGE